MAYTQLTQEQRYQIQALLKMEHSQTEIAETLGVHKSTISRELQRNRGKRGYRPKQAHQFALQRRKKACKRITADIWALVEEKLRQDWSPEQIAGRFKEEGIAISHEHIYQYIYADKRVGGDLWKHLRCKKKRRKRVGDYDRRGKIPNRKSIEERPEVVEQRTRLGDWEVDLMLGKDHQGVLVTLTERRSRFTLLRGHVSHSCVRSPTNRLNWSARPSLTCSIGYLLLRASRPIMAKNSLLISTLPKRFLWIFISLILILPGNGAPMKIPMA